MKQKDIVYLLVAVVIFLVAGYLGYTQLIPKKAASSKTIQVEKIGSIPAELDSEALEVLANPARVRDYSSPLDLSGLGNKAPFGN